MAYEPTNWKDGDLVTSAKLNKIEQGIASGGGMVVPVYTFDGQTQTITCNMTYADILSAIQENKCIGCIVVSQTIHTFMAYYEANDDWIEYRRTVLEGTGESFIILQTYIQHNSNNEIIVDGTSVPINSEQTNPPSVIPT